MINMIKADIYRVFHNYTIYAAILASLVIIAYCVMEGTGFYPGLNIMDYGGDVNAPLVREDYDWESSHELSDIDLFRESLSEEHPSLPRAIAAYNMNLYAMVLIVLAFLVSDLSNGTVKNTLSSAINRKKYFLAKFLMINATTFVLVVVMNIYTYYLGDWIGRYAFMLPAETLTNVLKVTAYQMPMLLGTVSMMTFWGVVTKRSHIFIISTAAILVFVPYMLYFTWAGYDWEFLRIFLWKYQQHIALLWLASFPPADYVATCAVIGACEIAASGILGYLVFKKTDV